MFLKLWLKVESFACHTRTECRLYRPGRVWNRDRSHRSKDTLMPSCLDYVLTLAHVLEKSSSRICFSKIINFIDRSISIHGNLHTYFMGSHNSEVHTVRTTLGEVLIIIEVNLSIFRKERVTQHATFPFKNRSKSSLELFLNKLQNLKELRSKGYESPWLWFPNVILKWASARFEVSLKTRGVWSDQ